jgi:hypothetical protein
VAKPRGDIAPLVVVDHHWDIHGDLYLFDHRGNGVKVCRGDVSMLREALRHEPRRIPARPRRK